MKSDVSNLSLNGVNTDTGDTIINSGTLTLSDANTYTGKTSIVPLNINASGTFIVSSFNSVSNPVASSRLGRPTTVANGTIDLGEASAQARVTLRYTGADGGLLKLAIVTSAATEATNLVFTGSGNTAVTDAITQAGSAQTLTKNGAGILTLSGANTYTGGTVIAACTLFVNGAIANSATGRAAVTVTGGRPHSLAAK